jgi:hypothetical protein
MAPSTVDRILANTLLRSLFSPTACANLGFIPPADIAIPVFDLKNSQTNTEKNPKNKSSPVGNNTPPMAAGIVADLMMVGIVSSLTSTIVT